MKRTVRSLCATAVMVGAMHASAEAVSAESRRDPAVGAVRDLGSATLDGQPDGAGGCEFDGTVRISDGFIQARETALDVANCRLTLHFDTPSGLVAPRQIYLLPTARTSVVTSTLPLPLPLQLVADPVPKAATGKTYWEDPPGIDVNSVTADVAFDSDGACASAGAHSSAGTDGYFVPSGWSRDFFNQSPSADCAGVRHALDAQYTNNAFCTAADTAIGGPIGAAYAGTLPPTRTFYQPTILTGRPDGLAELYWNAAKSGNCQRLLSFGYSLNNSPSSVK